MSFFQPLNEYLLILIFFELDVLDVLSVRQASPFTPCVIFRLTLLVVEGLSFIQRGDLCQSPLD
jgi:hypothetical protein